MDQNNNNNNNNTPYAKDNNDNDDDDDIADLFSFGSSTFSSSSSSTTMNTMSDTTDVSEMNLTTRSMATVTTQHPTTTTESDLTTSSMMVSSSILFASLPSFLTQRIPPPTYDRNPNHNSNSNSHYQNQNTHEPDSFLQLLDAETSRSSSSTSSVPPILISSSSSLSSLDPTTTSSSSTNGSYHHHHHHGTMLDAATVDILHWLDSEDDNNNNNENDSNMSSHKNHHATVENALFLLEQSKQIPTPTTPTLVTLPPIFTSFHDALWSPEATVAQIRDLWLVPTQPDPMKDDDDAWITAETRSQDDDTTDTTQPHRAQLYCRMICHNKSLDTILQGSLADSFQQWKMAASSFRSLGQNDNVDRPDGNGNQSLPPLPPPPPHLAVRISNGTGRSVSECALDLTHLVQYHQQQQHPSTTIHRDHGEISTTTQSASSSSAAASSTTSSSSSIENTTNHHEQNDTLLPMVAATLLSTNLPVAAASVVLSQIIPTFIPLLALPPATERWEAALFLHSEFYLLACYHIPLLVLHLDRYIPGWYWPKLPPPPPPSVLEPEEQMPHPADAVSIGRNLTKQGQIPLSWLVSHLSGECDGTMLPMDIILRLWDRIVTGGPNHSATRFFLTLAVLERRAASLLVLTGPELVQAVQNIWTLEHIDEHKESNEKEWKYEWWPQAFCLQLSTPESVLHRLQNVEDEAVQHALQRKQERAEAQLRERLEAEAMAYREAQELKAEEARVRLSRARLVAFYRKHAPEKESNIEQIMEAYDGRLDVLDFKLKGKYGEGFNPAVKAKPPPTPKTNLLAKMNQRLKRNKTGIDEDVLDSAMEERKPVQVSVFVTAEEVLPVICWSKEATAARGMDESRRRKAHPKRRHALKFYLIDCRSELAAQEQGRFPTAFHLSPETLHDPDKLQEHEETLESFRGAVHIVIMGEGFNAIPNLYNQKLSPKLQELMEQDESRTNLCALFFQKRGFCFVSLLAGGFCAAHSWLVRDGPKHHLQVSSVLVDYNPEQTLFGQLETLHNASMTEKAQRKMSNLLEASMTTVTKRAIQLERLTAELNDGKDGQRQGFRKLFGRSDASSSTTMAATGFQDVNETVIATDNTSTEDANAVKQGSFVPTRAEAADGSTLIDALAAPTVASPTLSIVKESISPTVGSSSPLSTPTVTATTTSSATVAATNKLGKFFQQTTEAVGVAAAAAAATASSTIANSSHRSDAAATTSNNAKSKEEMSNPFKGFGAAFQQTRARFGNTGSTTTSSSEPPPPPILPSTASTTMNTATVILTPPSTSPSSTGFGFNSFRKSTMSRVLQKASTLNQPQQQQQVPTEDKESNDDKEISVSFV